MNNQFTKREHFVPVYLLNKFTDSGNLFCFNKDSKKVFITKPDDVFFENDLYETKFNRSIENYGDYFQRNKYENEFSDLEGECKTVIDRVIDKCEKNYKNTNALICTQEEIKVLCKMIANMLVRNPKYINALRLDSYDKDYLQPFRSVLDILGFGDEFEPIVKHTELGTMVSSAFKDGDYNKILHQMMKLDFFFGRAADDEFFLISDFPFMVMNRHNDLSNVEEALLPISKKYILIFTSEKILRKKRNRVLNLNKEDTREINRAVVESSIASIVAFGDEPYLNTYLNLEDCV